MNNDDIRELLACIRQQCDAAVWSDAVHLAREHAVEGESIDSEQACLRVLSSNSATSHLVTLWPEEQDWTCECDSASGQVCVHVAASVIALNQARKAGTALPRSNAAVAQVGYRFQRVRGDLSFDRVLVVGRRETRLDKTLAATAQQRPAGVKVVARDEDWRVEKALAGYCRGVLGKAAYEAVLSALHNAQDVQLDGKPVGVGESCAPVQLVVEDCDAGIRVRAEQNPAITEVFASGVVLCGDRLRAVGELGLTVSELHEYRVSKLVARADVAHFLSDELPALQKRVPVVVRSATLPKTNERLLPRVLVHSDRRGDELVLLATIVYGDPAVARVDADRLTHLRGDLPVRRLEMEKRLWQKVQAELGLTVGQTARFRGLDAIDAADRIRIATSGKKHEVSVQGKAHGAFYLVGPVRGELSVHGDDFEVQFSSDKGKRADPGAVLRAWTRGESVVPLLDGGFGKLPTDFLSRYGQILSDLLMAKSVGGDRLPTSALPDLAKLCDALGVERPPSFDRLRVLLEDMDAIPQASLPADLTVPLRAYQQRGVDWLCFLRSAGLGALLADDMGLGKTLQGMCAMQGKTLIVAPTSVVHNWVDEIHRFRPTVRVNLYHGPLRQLSEDADVTLTTYALLRGDCDKLAQRHWDTLILDEAHAIKNPDSQVAQAAYSMRADFRIAMTGTPVENRLDELWSQMHAVNRGLLGTREDFRASLGQPISDGTPGAIERLRERIRPFVLRRRKSQVAMELPPRTDVVLHCELEEAEREVYDGLRGATLASVVDKLRAGQGVMAALELLLRLRQAACHAGLVPGQRLARSSKLALLVDRLQQLAQGGHKALVFSQWTSLLDLAEPMLDEQQLRYVRLDGSTRDRASVVREFQQHDDVTAMLISLKAGGTGLNLTAADHVFLLDPWWNPAVEDQAADRAHRIGQQRPVMVYKLVAKDTVEERIIELQRHKRQLASAALDGADVASALTRDELLALLY